ncbi:VOC family protein [Longispora albida]|uniref:VOC family protein n=1 Tax=Longispora albida TaxID=203523 RepID=UPI00036A159F|nr:VOC family protein [Longispora albida]
MLGTLDCVVLDCPDPHALGAFYRELLGGTINQPDPRWRLDDDWVTLHTPSGLVLAFQRAENHQPPRWPDPEHPQQFHLDIHVADMPTADTRVLELGATLLDTSSGWRVYADPAGHPFCLLGK